MLFTLTAFALLLVVGCDKAFRPFAPPDGSFTVQMPGKPASSTETLNFTQTDGRSLSLDFQGYGAKTKGVSYLVLYADLPQGATVNLSSVVQSLAGAWKGSVLSESASTLAGQPARSFSTSVNAPAAGTAHGLVAAINGRVYVLMAAGTKCNATDDNVLSFLNSFVPTAPVSAPEPAPPGGKPVRPSLTSE
jgi:hypothetical protein